MLSEKIGLEVDLFEVPDRKFGSYEKVGPKVSPLALRVTGLYRIFKLIYFLLLLFYLLINNVSFDEQ